MRQVCAVAVHVRAPPDKVFASVERTLSGASLPAGAARPIIAERLPPQRLVWQAGTGRAAVCLAVTLHPATPAAAGTGLHCALAMPAASPARHLLARLLAVLVRRKLQALAQRMCAVAEGDQAQGAGTLSSAGLWHRSPDLYRGLAESCAPGLHAVAAGLLAGQLGRTHGEVLDLGAGTGAWLARLRDAGYTRLAAVELSVDDFGLTGVAPWRLDLNQPFADSIGRRFHFISALEIVEHLDSPRAFLREVHRLLTDDGLALVSMPNTACWQGRLRFLRRGEHRYFEEGDYAQRHISPMTDLQMRLMFREIGMRPLVAATAGSFDGPLRKALLAPVAVAARGMLGPRATGDVAVYLLQRTDPDRSAPGAAADYLASRQRHRDG